jgi:hypothetical protein
VQRIAFGAAPIFRIEESMFYDEDGGTMFFWNIGTHVPGYMISHPTEKLIFIVIAMSTSDLTYWYLLCELLMKMCWWLSLYFAQIAEPTCHDLHLWNYYIVYVTASINIVC